MKTEIVYLPIEKLHPYANNPRINDDAVDIVAKSIQNFGFKNPIVCTDDYEIINGHTRHKAAQKLGIKEVPCIIASDLTKEQIMAFRIADNRTSELSVWDDEKLRIEIAELENLGVNIEDTAFAEKDLEELMNIVEDINDEAKFMDVEGVEGAKKKDG